MISPSPYPRQSELHQIVTKRRNFEYQLHRRATLKQDFLRALEYEKKLESLRRLRVKTLKVGKTGECCCPTWSHRHAAFHAFVGLVAVCVMVSIEVI